eukprot:SM000186S04150  [mRNA]  locus=s186:112226:114319:- [translate_table: standard]
MLRIGLPGERASSAPTPARQLALARAAASASLAVSLPSIVADSYPEERRGVAFGWLQAAGQAGAAVALAASPTAAAESPSHSLTASPHRLAFLAVAATGALHSCALFQFGRDPVLPPGRRSRPSWTLPARTFLAQAHEDVAKVAAGLRSTLLVRTVQLIVAEEVVGQFSWHATWLLGPWLSLSGFAPSTVAWQVIMMYLGRTCGSVAGGWAGDLAAFRYPSVGRILCTQVSVTMAIPLAAALLHGLPAVTASDGPYGLALFLMGFITAWATPACRWPVLSEVVSRPLRTSLFALYVAVGKITAALVALAMSSLAANGWRPVSSQSIGLTDPASDLSPSPLPLPPNVVGGSSQALAKNIFLSFGISYMICAIVVTGLYWTYPADRGRARIEAWIEDSERAIQMAEYGQDVVKRRGSTWHLEDDVSDSPPPEAELIARQMQRVPDMDDEGEGASLLLTEVAPEH